MLPQAPDPNDPRQARPPQNKKNEVIKLQSEITTEVTKDAPYIARMVFGDTKDHPDIVGLPNQQVDNVYRQKFIAQDREWLQAEARRDPEQFLKVADRIGVSMPEPGPVAPQDLHPAMQLTGAPQAPPMALPPPMPPPAMVAPPVAPMPPSMPLAPGPMPGASPAPAPVILGRNGWPLPPSVPAMAEGGVVTQPTLALIGEAGPEMVVPLSGQPGPAAVQPPAPSAPPTAPAPPPISPWDDLIRQHLPDQHQDLAQDPRFIRTVAAAARVEGLDNPQQYQFGYKADDPKTWLKYGGRGLWQFDINKGAKGYGVPEEKLMDPNYQASVIVPEYADNYKRVVAEIAAGRRPPMSDDQLASYVAGITERPYQYDVPTSPARKNYARAYQELQGQAAQGR